ncbi:sugar ABC transporter substrate-binding protein [Tropicimonas sp. IMCC34011]|uniref:ABC transporter substrate-binding protein n=1 Tax=Tropicimonas sp. IMCC34011 TaxID=2248759 RepID=UPI000E263FB2|nr:sugar ABC transporter substrate-binding protein [Tropicimonas sp. IMCC34011]
MRISNLLLGTAAIAAGLGAAASADEITVATINVGHMVTAQRLTAEFEAAHPDIKVNWVTLDEGTLRQRITADIATDGGQFDVMTIGMYEAPIWAERGWLLPLDFDDAYDVDDIYEPIRAGLSYDGQLYAAPFYGESSMVMYNRELVEAAGYDGIDDHASWQEIREIAAAITDREAGFYGICLRGKPGWGENMALIGTMANSFGGSYFNDDWTPAFETQPWRDAVQIYVDMMNESGPPGAESNSFGESLALMNEGRCGIWIDATIGASLMTDPTESRVAGKVGFAQAPNGGTENGSNWLWAWALAVPAGTDSAEDATTFIEWLTSKDYIRLVGETEGWAQVPTGSRESTYDIPEFMEATSFADAELEAILTARPEIGPNKPYVGVQFAAIPEFQAIGNAVGQQMTAALSGELTVDEALANSQEIADREMRRAGYY